MTLIRHRQDPSETITSLPDWPLSTQGWWSRLDEMFRDSEGHRMLRVEEFDEDRTRVIRAEMPGLDPEKDVEVSVSDGLLTIRAERSEEEETSKRQFRRKEIRYGGFSRTVELPDGVKSEDVRASYKDGILEVRVPVPDEPKNEATRIPIDRS